ncbi:MAG: putative membrane protein (DUF2142) [Solidesulfovibrio magneticus str. Maddingley MBC34]|uniref:Putative membrane protein (DUF2142) n=1 Tax=Solidesulfovibrio magneticus str. Maddingley MBC34 TaxID=1206767 RepID=K6GMK8_9BACT|nr:MAG: putative membrane protein (DUF2142) [Solidesulfovibrio magneticus str. Maddingley MBC34]
MSSCVKLKTAYLSFFFVIMLLVLSVVSTVVPPFQSPDEFAHVARAFSVSQGQMVLHAPDASASGGMVDAGLCEYGQLFTHVPFHKDQQFSKNDLSRALFPQWTHQAVFVAMPGTGYYFPAIYVPMALGFGIGYKLDLTVQDSYYLARIFSIVSICLILTFAFSLFPPNPVVLVILFFPMALFQFSSATIDGVSFALTVLVLSSYMRIARDRESVPSWVAIVLCLSVFFVATCRTNLVALFAMAFVACIQLKRKSMLLLCGLLFIVSFSWIVYTTVSTVDLRVLHGVNPKDLLVRYLLNPQEFFAILWNTLTSNNNMGNYWAGSVGLLGWLDTVFEDVFYWIMFAFLAFAGVLSVSWQYWKKYRVNICVLICCAIISVLLIFLALLVTWSGYPTTLIKGVQGRYFIPPMIVAAYCLSRPFELSNKIHKYLLVPLVLSTLVFSTVTTIHVLVWRYYIVSTNSNNTLSREPGSSSCLPNW